MTEPDEPDIILPRREYDGYELYLQVGEIRGRLVEGRAQLIRAEAGP